jgi:AcrR family transcriptional regulator
MYRMGWESVTSVSPSPQDPSSPVRVTKRRAQTRARLLAAGYRVWAERGFWQTKVEEICAEAGFTRGAFYSNFDSLDDLFFALYDQQADRVTALVASVFADAGGACGGTGLIQQTAEALPLDREWLMIKTEYLLHAARNPVLAERLAAHRAQLRAAIEHRLRHASSQLHPPPAIAAIPDAARAVVAAYDGITVAYLLDNDEETARSWLTQLLTALLGQ